jgi:catalase
MNDETLYNELLDALYETSGQHNGYRVTHAKGVFAHGIFTASEYARGLSRAIHLQGQPIPVVLRFSNFSGIPSTPDNDPMANPRGLGVRFMASDTVFTDIVAHSFDGFPVGTPKAFLGFLRGISASLAEPPDTEPLMLFLANHPQARNYLEALKPAPTSYVAERYFGVNAFRFINAHGNDTFGRYRIDPIMVEPHLDDKQVALRPPDFLAQELAHRLQRSPARMRLMLQLPASGDFLHDGSVSWPNSGANARQEIELGIITIRSTHFDDESPCHPRNLALNPGNLIDGIGLSSDPMIMARQRIYDLALKRRQMT